MASLVLPSFTRARNLSDPCVAVFIRVVLQFAGRCHPTDMHKPENPKSLKPQFKAWYIMLSYVPQPYKISHAAKQILCNPP